MESNFPSKDLRNLHVANRQNPVSTKWQKHQYFKLYFLTEETLQQNYASEIKSRRKKNTSWVIRGTTTSTLSHQLDLIWPWESFHPIKSWWRKLMWSWGINGQEIQLPFLSEGASSQLFSFTSFPDMRGSFFMSVNYLILVCAVCIGAPLIEPTGLFWA